MAQLDGPFGDLARFLDIPRVTGLALSPDGGRLVAGVQNLSPNRKKFISSLWQIDLAGGAPTRLTRSASGESAPDFLPDGSLLFTAKRADPQAAKDDPAPDGSGLWLLPASGGEARLLAAPPAGVDSVAIARDTGAIVLSTTVLPGAADLAQDAQRRKARKDADVTAILHDTAHIREWDTQLGPDLPRLFTAPAPVPAAESRLELADLTGDVGLALGADGAPDVTPDGATVVCAWWVELPKGAYRADLVAIDVATGGRTTLASDEEADFGAPLVSPDGRWAIAGREFHGDNDESYRLNLWLQPLDGGAGRILLPELELWPRAQAWSQDSSTVYFVADELGHAPVFQVDVASGALIRLTGDHGAYSHVRVAPDGTVYALRSAVDSPPRPVRLASGAADQQPEFLSAPGDRVTLPGRWEEVVATAEDGQPIHGRLVLPEGEGPAPLLLFIHGGPHTSANNWNWRWSPWVMAHHGYAVLLPDPGLSTGYGRAFDSRGWGEWGAEPFTDLMAITDAVVARPDIDETRTAALGGSFGGYMANWVATHTDRFKAIVSHAGLWNLAIESTCDLGWFSRREFGDIQERPERWERNSPHRFVADITTPMLVIHGDKDYRVPISNALWQWYDLQSQGSEAKFLYYPDENHWILKPQHSVLWYETVLAFLAQHVLGQEWRKPELL